MFSRRNLPALLLLGAFPLAFGQSSDPESWRDGKRLPNDIELKSNYCIAVNQGFAVDNIKFRRDSESLLQSVADQSHRKLISEGIARSRLDSDILRNNLNRLESYVLPRRPYLDSSAMSAAYDRGRADYVRHSNNLIREQCWETCEDSGKTPKPEQAACFTNCDSVDPTTNRILDCRRITFLPY
jgi:hypothetical protein